jgi:hypothetical protein
VVVSLPFAFPITPISRSRLASQAFEIEGIDLSLKSPETPVLAYYSVDVITPGCRVLHPHQVPAVLPYQSATHCVALLIHKNILFKISFLKKRKNGGSS